MTPPQFYYFFLALAIVISGALFFRLAQSSERPRLEIIKIGTGILLLASLGSKIFHTLFEAQGHALPGGEIAQSAWELLQADPWHGLRFFSPGYVFWGAVIWASGGLIILLPKSNSRDLYLDIFAQSALIGLAVGRVGCYFAGCCFGTSQFPIPIQLIESAFAFIFFIYLFTRTQTEPGTKFSLFLIGYSLFRFFIEFFRGDTERGIWLSFISTSQIFAVIIIGILAFRFLIKNPGNEITKLR